MKQTPKFTSLNALTAEKERLKKAITQQEKRIVRRVEYAKETAKTELAPTRLIQTVFCQLFSWKRMQSNPFTSFKLGYKIIGFLMKKLFSKR